MDTSRHIIISFLKSLQNRYHLQTLILKFTQTLLIGFCILSVMYVGIRIVQFPISMTIVTLIIITGSIISGFCLSSSNRKTLTDIASFVDVNQTLKERVSTSFELIQQNHHGELVELQILDSAEEVSKIDSTKILPNNVPPLLKWISIPLLIITFSFAVPRQYELTKPLTLAENQAIEKTINVLSDEFENIDPNIRKQMNKTVKQLGNVKDVASAHNKLRNLISDVRKQKIPLPDTSTVKQATQASQHFFGMDNATLADELEQLAKQDELSPELQTELNKLFAKIKESLPQGELRKELDQLESKTVSHDKLQEIANVLNQANLLNQLEEQLIESRKDIALASIDTEGSKDGFVRSVGAPGHESSNKEMQGTLVNVDDTNIRPSVKNYTSTTANDETEMPLIGSETPSIQVPRKKLQLNSQVSSNSQTITRVFTGNINKESTEPEYLPFSDVVLNAQRNYANAIQNDSIPVRYRSQIKAYLEAITKIDEK